MKIEDLTGLSKPFIRLIEVVSAGIGAVSRPYLIRREADAHAYEAGKISETLNEIADKYNLPVVYKNGKIEIWQKTEDQTLILPSVNFDERCVKRIDYQQRKMQDNIENVTSAAARELSNTWDVPEETPDKDWITRFFSSAQEVSTKQMQELWGRILAGEIKRPGSFSLRTIEFIRNLTKSEAQIFEAVAKMAIGMPYGAWVVAVNNKELIYKKRQIYMSYQIKLSELGIIYPSILAYDCFKDKKISEIAILSDDHLLLLKRGGIENNVKLPIWKFTDIGKELLPLIQKPLDLEYFESIGHYFIKRKGKAYIAKINERCQDGKINYVIIKEIKI